MQTKGWEQVLVLDLAFILQFWESGAWTHICILYISGCQKIPICYSKNACGLKIEALQEEHTFCLINKWAVPASSWIFWPSKQNLHLVYRVSIFFMIWLLAEEYLLSSIQLTWKLGLQGDACWFKDCREAFKPVFACIIDDSIWLSLAWQVPSTMNIFQWNNIIKEVSRCRVSIHETDIHDHNIRNWKFVNWVSIRKNTFMNPILEIELARKCTGLDVKKKSTKT